MKRTLSLAYLSPAGCSLAFAAILCCLVGCGGAYDEGYEAGYESGYQKGLDAGTAQTTAKYEAQWGLIGLTAGFVLGGAVVVFFTRRYISGEYRQWKQHRQVRALLSECDVTLDKDLHERVLQLGIRKRRIEEDIRRNGGRMASVMQSGMQSRLRRMDAGIVRLASILQQLRSIRKEVSVDETAAQKRIAEYERQLASMATTPERIDIEEALDIERRRLDASRKNLENIRRCERKLHTLGSFLDNLIMTVGNIRTIEEQDAFQRYEKQITEEVEDLEKAFEHALADLLDVSHAASGVSAD